MLNNQNDEQQRQRRILIAIACVFTLVMLVLGLLTIFTQHFSGTTKQGKFFTVDGTSAQLMGGVQLSLGMLMLILVMPNKKAAIWWGCSWAALFILCLTASIYSKA
jgi:ABC-type sulfate transport system permease subunit